METKERKGIQPEWVLTGIMLLCAALLVWMVIMSKPYIPGKEDPLAVHPHAAATAPAETEGEEMDPALLHQNQTEPTEPEETVEPTIPPEANPYGRLDFQYDRNNYLYALKTDSYPGIDVSAFQGKIDWEKVKASGIEFAIIRLGYRGYGSGKLVEDEYAVKNLEGAREAGLKVGAYFFSQALSIRETDEEIAYMLKILDGFQLDMPIILDWEIPTNDARTIYMDARTLTDIQLHFCGQMRNRGFQPMIYFNWHQSEKLYYLSELEEYPFWLALYQDRMTYPWKVEMWQWTANGKVPGINGPVDINVYMD